MTTDRELLDLAAKAAGIQIDLTYTDKFQPASLPDGYVVIINGSGGHSFWSPIKDSGDALELAVTLRFTVDTPAKHFRAHVQSQDRQKGVMANSGQDGLDVSDPLADTRLAITCAAAEVGKAMPL